MESKQSVLNWKVPTGTMPCWFVSESEKNDIIKNNKPLRGGMPSFFFKLKNRLDNNFIEGHVGHCSKKDVFYDYHYSYSVFSDYRDRKPYYLSFDGVTLYQPVEILPTTNSPITFILRRIDAPQMVIKDKAFMIMPFGDDSLNGLYQEHIRPFLKNEMGIDIYRADDFHGNDVIIETIYKQIEESEFILADTTLPNKNAFFELGYATKEGKEILTMQSKDEKHLFFDRAHIRSLIYDINEVDKLLEDLRNNINAIRAKVG